MSKKTSAKAGTAVLARNKDSLISCKLTSEELRKRRETVLAALKGKVLDRKELPDGFAFKFPGDDKMVDELTEFIKSERICCSFLVFGLSVSGDGSEAWLSLTGPGGSKEMIASELGL